MSGWTHTHTHTCQLLVNPNAPNKNTKCGWCIEFMLPMNSPRTVDSCHYNPIVFHMKSLVCLYCYILSIPFKSQNPSFFSKKSWVFFHLLPSKNPHLFPSPCCPVSASPGHIHLGVGGTTARGRSRAAAQKGRLRGADRAENASDGEWKWPIYRWFFWGW